MQYRILWSTSTNHLNDKLYRLEQEMEIEVRALTVADGDIYVVVGVKSRNPATSNDSIDDVFDHLNDEES